MTAHTLILGDCFAEMEKMPAGSVDLVYMDPPFHTQRDFGEFSDKWESLSDYVAFMEARVTAAWRVLGSNGSLWLHCDPNASHYLKVMMDDAVGRQHFRNEIIWSYSNKNAATKKCYPRSHDVLFYYAKKDAPLTLERVALASDSAGADVRRSGWKAGNTHSDKGVRQWVYVYDWDKYNAAIKAGKVDHTGREIVDYSDRKHTRPLGTVWEMPFLCPTAKERVDYPTQKPLALLERIIKSSSSEGDLVLDPFMGSGTTGVAATQHGRRFTGIDVNENAVAIARKRLGSTQGAML